MKSAVRYWTLSCVAALVGLLALSADPAVAASRVTMTLDPLNFSVTESAELTITVSGDEDATPIIPHVPGLIINPEGQSSRVAQVNGGAVTAFFARTYRVTAAHEGTFTIPPFQVGNATTAALTIHVGAAGVAGATGAAGATGGAGRPRTSANAPDTDRDSAATVAKTVRELMPTMKVVLPKGRLYVGELVPIQIKAYFRVGVGARADGPLAAVGDAFTVSGLDKRGTQTQEAVGGVTYNVLTWNSVLGALKSGDYPIALELPLTLTMEVPDADSDMASRLRALFGTRAPGAFMDDSVFGGLFGRVVEKNVTLKTDATPVTVQPLPVDGRPANFSGAVGQFQVAGELTPAAGAVGDPLTFKLTITGRGNLSRVSADALQDSAQWRVYRADSKVTADDDSGVQGFKTFSQPVVPLQAGQLELPGLSFSYFDPEAERYVTRETPSLKVRVTPGAGSTQAAAALQAGPLTSTAQTADGDALAPDASVTGGHTATLESPVLQPWFIGSAVAPLVLMLCAVTLIRRHQLRSGDAALVLHAARLAAVSINLESMAAALNRGDSPAFFTAARHALQEKLADMGPSSAGQLPAEDAAEIQAILVMAEKAIYGGESPGAELLRAWQHRVLTQMDRLEAVA
jgi:hypothetical protein